jgi:hypothetical protein
MRRSRTRRQIGEARRIWKEINAVNLEENIAHTTEAPTSCSRRAPITPCSGFGCDAGEAAHRALVASPR